MAEGAIAALRLELNQLAKTQTEAEFVACSHVLHNLHALVGTEVAFTIDHVQHLIIDCVASEFTSESETDYNIRAATEALFPPLTAGTRSSFGARRDRAGRGLGHQPDAFRRRRVAGQFKLSHYDRFLSTLATALVRDLPRAPDAETWASHDNTPPAAAAERRRLPSLVILLAGAAALAALLIAGWAKTQANDPGNAEPPLTSTGDTRSSATVTVADGRESTSTSEANLSTLPTRKACLNNVDSMIESLAEADQLVLQPYSGNLRSLISDEECLKGVASRFGDVLYIQTVVDADDNEVAMLTLSVPGPRTG